MLENSFISKANGSVVKAIGLRSTCFLTTAVILDLMVVKQTI